MTKEDAINFLAFSYFGVDIKCDVDNIDNADEVIYAIIDRAYRDASSHVFSVTDDKDNKKKRAVNLIKDWIEKEKTDYQGVKDIWGELKKIYGEDISYGIAQKWINMATKYLAVLCLIMDENSTFVKKYKSIEDTFYDDFHMPIDRYIMKALSQEGYPVIPQKERKENEVQIGKYSESGKKQSKAWSEWEEKDYNKFRKALKESSFYEIGKSELDWEAEAWIKEAKKNKSYVKKYAPETN